MSASGPDLSVLIVNYNGMDLLPGCLAAVDAARGSLEAELVIVDNASSDGSPEWLEAQAGARLLRNARNEGFARAMNQALRAARGKHLLWLNADCRLSPGSLPAVVSLLDATPERAVILGPRLLGDDGRPQPSALSFSSALGALLHALGARALLRLPGAPRAAAAASAALGQGAVADYLATRSATPAPRHVDWLTGACLLVSRETARRVGPLDEDFFMYSEDEAWCRRAATVGVTCEWHPEWIAHHTSRASGRGSPYIACHYYRSLWLYHTKFRSPGRPMIAASILALCSLRALRESFRQLLGRRDAALRRGLWLSLARWILQGEGEPCGPVPPPAWPPAAGRLHVP